MQKFLGIGPQATEMSPMIFETPEQMEVDFMPEMDEKVPPMQFGEDFVNDEVFQDAITDAARAHPGITPLKVAALQAEELKRQELKKDQTFE